VPADQISTTIVSFEEQSRGWLARVSEAQTKPLPRQVDAYGKLHRHLSNYRMTLVLPFDDASAVEYERLRISRVRVGTLDLRIAAIVLANGATLLSRNLVDFRQVPSLDVQDWTTPLP
jgi:tRNA(fMet)-specific endonuclease VapC